MGDVDHTNISFHQGYVTSFGKEATPSYITEQSAKEEEEEEEDEEEGEEEEEEEEEEEIKESNTGAVEETMEEEQELKGENRKRQIHQEIILIKTWMMTTAQRKMR